MGGGRKDLQRGLARFRAPLLGRHAQTIAIAHGGSYPGDPFGPITDNNALGAVSGPKRLWISGPLNHQLGPIISQLITYFLEASTQAELRTRLSATIDFAHARAFDAAPIARALPNLTPELCPITTS